MKGTWPWHNPLVPAHHKGRRQYGVRDVRCSCCSKLFRAEDVDPESGRCAWCQWDHRLVIGDDRFCRRSLEE